MEWQTGAHLVKSTLNSVEAAAGSTTQAYLPVGGGGVSRNKNPEGKNNINILHTENCHFTVEAIFAATRRIDSLHAFH